MLQIDNILVPVDFSECARRAAAHAMHVAKRHDAAVHVLHVVRRSDPVAPHRAMSSTWHGDPRAVAELDLPVVTDADDAAANGVPSGPRVLPVQVYASSVARAVTDYAEKNDVDLIVVGRQPRSQLRRLVRPGTAETVIRDARCSIMTVNAEHASTPGQGIRRLLVAVDLSDISLPLVAHARALAATYGAELDLLYVLEEPRPAAFRTDRFRAAVPEIAGYAYEAVRHLAADAGGPAVPTQCHVLVGRPDHVIIEFIEAQGIDFAVLATHDRDRLVRPLGRVTRGIVHRAPCLVAVMKHDGKSLLPRPEADKLRDAVAHDGRSGPLAQHLDAVRDMYLRVWR